MPEENKPKQASRVITFGTTVITALITATAGGFKDLPTHRLIALGMILVFATIVIGVHKLCFMKKLSRKQEDVN